MSVNPVPDASVEVIGSSATHNAVDTSIELANTVFAVVKEVGEMLNNVPYVNSLSGVILQIIKIRNEIEANEERCHEIINKVLRMSKSIYDKLALGARSDQREKLIRLEGHLNKHERTLTDVHAALTKYQSRSRFSKTINRGLDQLNKHDRRLDELNTQLILDIIFEIIIEQAAPVATVGKLATTNAPGHVLPPKPHLMVQREVQFDAALKILLSAEPSRLPILGGGGFGKTTLARAILHDPKIAERYNSRYFLSCEGMTDVETILLGLGTMLGIKASPSSLLSSIRNVLETSPTLVCLDNFETPWEPSATRTKVEDLLASIADIPNLSLVLTMRGTQRPSKVAWSYPLLPPLSTLSSDSAKIILQTICPDHIIDEFTQKLLDAIEGIPLAITLISNLLRDGESSRALWIRWSKEQTSIVENGGDDRESNLNTSIILSIHSPRTRKDPGAIAFLAALSLLPDGFPFSALEIMEGYLGIDGIHKALQTLRAVALIKPDEANPSARVQMLSPIRLFCLNFCSSDISLALEKVVDYYIVIMLRARARGARGNAELYAQVVPEIQNIHSVFQRVYKIGYSRDITRLLEASVYLTDWSRYIGHLSQDTIQMALDRSSNFPIARAKCLMSLGRGYYREGHGSKAERMYREAARLFNEGGDMLQEALASQCLGQTLRSMRQLDEAEIALNTSLELYTIANDDQGQADAHFCLGELYINKRQHSKAEATLMSALEAYQHLSPAPLISQVNAAVSLTRVHVGGDNLVKAKEYAIQALDFAKQANYALGEGNALGWLGRIYLSVDNVLDAKDTFEQALAIAKKNDSINHLIAIDELAQVYIQLDQLSEAEALLTASSKAELDVVQIPVILTTLGWLYICAGRLDKAEPVLDVALQRFRKFSRKGRQAEVLAHLGTVYSRSNRLDDCERAMRSIPDLGPSKEVKIHRKWILGDLYTLKGEFEDAEAALDTALAQCQNKQSSYSYQQGNILRSMGTLLVKRGCIDEAIEKFQEAREFHRKAQWASEQATDLKCLGEVYEMVGRSEDAEATFEVAEVLMESVREARTLKP